MYCFMVGCVNSCTTIYGAMCLHNYDVIVLGGGGGGGGGGSP